MQSQKICIWLSTKAVRVPVKSSTHEPQASRTWQARLQSAFHKILLSKESEGSGRKKKDVMRLTMVWVAEKKLNQSESIVHKVATASVLL